MAEMHLSDFATLHGCTVTEARDILAAADVEMLTGDDSRLWVDADDARPAMFAAGKYPLITGVDVNAPPIEFGPADDAELDFEDCDE
jgi:hypothetical protein